METHDTEMKRFHFIPFSVLLIFLAAAPTQAIADDEAAEAGTTHLDSLLNGDYAALAGTYADKVVLMPGHEFLKDEYGLAGPKGRDEAVAVERATLLEKMNAADAGRKQRTADERVALMKSLTFTVLEVAAGDFATEASDPVGTADGKLHFMIREGDVLLKVAPPKGDFLLFQLRQIGDGWRVVAEYLD